ncbi:hypothetical protein LJC49_03585 [Ruminococcaceae bacterium OttesenSCG-928-I18]|nr:hypothetical protein [Ruminococcaceae bacterium OttesenSCG-928-I18]
MKKKKLLIIIIIAVVVLAVAGTLVFLIMTGRLFGGKDEASSSSLPASEVASVVSGPQGDVDETLGPETGVGQAADPSKFFEGHFYFQNATGVPLVELRLAPTGTQNWEDNLLDEEALVNGEIWSQPLMLRDVGTTWDLRVKDTNDREYVFTGLDMVNSQNFVLTLDGDNAVVHQA